MASSAALEFSFGTLQYRWKEVIPNQVVGCKEMYKEYWLEKNPGNNSLSENEDLSTIVVQCPVA